MIDPMDNSGILFTAQCIQRFSLEQFGSVHRERVLWLSRLKVPCADGKGWERGSQHGGERATGGVK